MKKQKGFTIIELVVVILLLGILTATALPRFMDVTDQAHDAVVEAVAGGLQTGTSLFHAQYIANGQPAAGSQVTGFGDGTLRTNGAGFPDGITVSELLSDFATTSDADADQTCVDIYEGLLQGGAPSVTTSDVTNGIPTTFTGADFRAYSGTGGTASTTCNYAYIAEGAVTDTISYDSTTGVVTF